MEDHPKDGTPCAPKVDQMAAQGAEGIPFTNFRGHLKQIELGAPAGNV